MKDTGNSQYAPKERSTPMVKLAVRYPRYAVSMLASLGFTQPKRNQRLIGSILFVCLLSFLAPACGTSSSPGASTVPSPTATQLVVPGTGPKGLPLYCPAGMAF